mgnify:CR=1 FL=1
MFSFCNDKHKIYQEDYNRYAYIDQKPKNHRFGGKNCDYRSNICNLWLFKSKTSSHQTFVIVPSLFNSSEILFFNQEQSFVEYLTLFGDVYLLEWIENTTSLHLSDYAAVTADVVRFLKNQESKDINLIGHCIGGNIAIFSNFIEDKIVSLTLLTTPWDYSYLGKTLLLSEFLEVKKAIIGLSAVPRIYVQMMFFMLFPGHYEAKIAKYFALDKNADREKYLAVEHWLASGIDLSSSLYNEILDDIIAKNALMKKDFHINDKLVSLTQIKVPTCIISAKDDQIAPLTSIAPLQKEIKNSKLILVDGGHIGYLVNNDQKFKQSYKEWFEGGR